MKSKYFSEFLGTALLFCTVVGSGIMGENLSSNDSLTLLANTLATVFALYFLITIFGDHSSHFNPVVSMVMLVRKEISTQVCIVFIILQISGAILGVMIANYIFELDPVFFSEKQRSGTHLFVSEILATFGLLMVILLSAKEKVAVTVAVYIGAAYWFTSSTSFANPAGTIGRSFSNTFAGISPGDILHFCVAQLIGALLALFVYNSFFKKPE
mgnify:FL=1